MQLNNIVPVRLTCDKFTKTALTGSNGSQTSFAPKYVAQMFYQDTGHGHSRWDLEDHQVGLTEQFLSQHLPNSGDMLTKDLPAAIRLHQQVAAAGHPAAMVALAEAADTYPLNLAAH